MAGADYIYCSVCNQKALYHEGDYPDGLTVLCAACAPLHVAVPVMALEDLLEQHDHFLYMMESPLEGEWDKTTSKQLRALLPKEETE